MPERPLDCSECKKPLYVCYIEIVGDKMTRTVMCADCPHLEKKLYGAVRKEGISEERGDASLACGNCGTTLEALRTGNPLGCAICYEVFADALIDTLLKENRISRHLTSNQDSAAPYWADTGRGERDQSYPPSHCPQRSFRRNLDPRRL